MAKTGVFITFEGGDGCGKSTQLALLHDALAAYGVDTVKTREPGGTPQAERIRALLLQRDSGAFDPVTEALLMFASRREHLVDTVWPALKAGRWVLSDRFADSSRAFQGAGMGVAPDTIEELYRMVAGDFQPDLTFIFDLEPEVGLARSMAREAGKSAAEDRYERMGADFHHRLRKGFLQIAATFPARCVVIDAARDPAAIHRDVVRVTSERFGLALKGVAHG